MATPRLPRARAFISYSHRDRAYLDRLHTHLKAALRDQPLDIWDDTQIKPGERWRDKIEQALVTARVAVVLVSPDFLASDFITQNELPPLLAAAEREGVVIIPVILKPCLFEESGLAHYQGTNIPSEPLSEMSDSAMDRIWVKLTRRMTELLNEPYPGKTLLIYTGYTSLITSVAWSPTDGRLIASGGWGNTVHVWEALTGQLFSKYTNHSGWVNAVAWSPDGKTIASGSYDRSVQVWEALTGQLLCTYRHGGPVNAVAWSPDKKPLLLGVVIRWGMYLLAYQLTKRCMCGR